MARAPRKAAEDVKVGDQILTPYHPRTWLPVTARRRHRPIVEHDPCVMLDTPKSRTWWRIGEMVPCRSEK